MEDVRKTVVKLLRTSDDSGGSIQDLLKLVGPSSSCVGQKCIAAI